MGRTATATEVSSFIIVVNFYKSLFPCCVYLLVILTEMTNNVPFSWSDKKERVFYAMKTIVASECINTYLDNDKHFNIYTDTSNYQVGAEIIQNSKSVASFSYKLTQSQLFYSIIKKNFWSLCSASRNTEKCNMAVLSMFTPITKISPLKLYQFNASCIGELSWMNSI